MAINQRAEIIGLFFDRPTTHLFPALIVIALVFPFSVSTDFTFTLDILHGVELVSLYVIPFLILPSLHMIVAVDILVFLVLLTRLSSKTGHV